MSNQHDDDPDRTQLRTVVRSTSTDICSEHALPSGTYVAEFEIIDVIGEGGFGIVYRALDRSLNRHVALKEYLPHSIARRLANRTIRPISQQSEEDFLLGLRSFVNEARLLARFDHVSLVKVFRFWEANGTAYMAMPLYEGATLKSTILQMDSLPDELWLKRLLAQVLDALEIVHDAGCVHRDIAPDNILILKDDRPLLLDFGAARQVLSNKTQALTSFLKSGYTPIEQYAEASELRQGPWTDVYALAATIYFAVSGKPPSPSVGRMVADDLKPLTTVAIGKYSQRFLAAIDQTLAVRPEDRPQSVAAFRELLDLEHSVPDGTKSASVAKERRKQPWRPSRRRVLHLSIALGVTAIVAYPIASLFRDETGVGTSSPQPFEPRADQHGLQLPPQTVEPELIPAFTPLTALNAAFDKRDRDIGVEVVVPRSDVRIGIDPLNFQIRSDIRGYVYVILVGTNSNVHLIFPNKIDLKNEIHPARELVLPRSNWKMLAGGPAGTNHLLVIVSPVAREFADAGMKEDGHFYELTSFGQRTHDRDAPALAGRPQCPDSSPRTCKDVYGAARFTIHEVEPNPAAPKS